MSYEKISILLCLIIILAFSGCSKITEEQTEKANIIYQTAKNAETIDVDDSDYSYYLSEFSLCEKNNIKYYIFTYYENDVFELDGYVLDGGEVYSAGRAVYHSYKIVGKEMVRCDNEISYTGSKLEIMTSNVDKIGTVTWDSAYSYDKQMKEIYKIAQHL